MNKKIILGFLLIWGVVTLQGQSYAVSVKAGSNMSFQKWSGTERSPLIAYHGKVGIESAEDDEKYNLYAELGYHERGSALRNKSFQVFGSPDIFNLPTQRYQFNNISLALGVKSKNRISEKVLAYYGIAIRGEYTISTNLDDFKEIVELNGGFPIFPIEEFVEHWNYGIDVTGGFEYQFSEYVNGIIELRLSPDFSNQYLQPKISLSGAGGTIPRTLPEQKVVNVSIELSVGLRFLRKIIYID